MAAWVKFLVPRLLPVTISGNSFVMAAVLKAGGVVTLAEGSCGSLVKSVVVTKTVVVMT